MNDMRIQLFGKLQIQTSGHSLQTLDSHRSEELLCYLLLHRRRQHHREVLVELICPERPADQAKKALRQTLWRLQSELDAGHTDDTCLLKVDRDWICVNPHCRLWLDVDILERTYALVENMPGEQLTADQTQLLQRAVDLYHDDLLIGWYEDWCLFERERLQNMVLRLLDKLMAYCEAHAEYDSGLRYGEEVLRHDRANERTYRRLMRLHFHAGARGKALYQFERCAAILRQELGVDPSPGTIAVYNQIRTGTLPGATRLASAPPPPNPQMAEVVEILARFETTLDEFHTRLRSEVESLQRALGIQS